MSFQDSTHFNFPLLEVSFSVPVFHELPSQLDHCQNLTILFDSPTPEIFGQTLHWCLFEPDANPSTQQQTICFRKTLPTVAGISSSL